MRSLRTLAVAINTVSKTHLQVTGRVVLAPVASLTHDRRHKTIKRGITCSRRSLLFGEVLFFLFLIVVLLFIRTLLLCRILLECGLFLIGHRAVFVWMLVLNNRINILK
jgi:hypothetical protein